ncbi:hypothetical protein [Cryptosporidium hominis TU502]|uniref:hypothetical protein n=1 Tax=Cryptosporidium hominis (strain TU502) TaxID=353151 RepID=UPI000045315A|nr:hypothetical protein [Cryptosporidium hominis TU502]
MLKMSPRKERDHQKSMMKVLKKITSMGIWILLQTIQKSKKKSKIIKAFKKIPIISPTISFLYSRLSNRGKKKRKAKKYIKTIRKLEIQFRRKAYGHFQEKEYQQGNELSQDDDQFMYLLSY